jgi:hypothetical protein
MDLLNDRFIEFPELINTTFNKIIELNSKYNYNYKFLKLLNIYEISKWKNLCNEYKALKKLVIANKHAYKKIINEFQILYKYYDLSVVETKTTLIDKFKNILDNNIFKLLTLQKTYKLINLFVSANIKKSNIIKVNIIPDNIKILLDLAYNIYNDLHELKYIIKRTKYKFYIKNY